MEKKMHLKSYRLDNSATIHIASLRKNHSNTFRVSATLTEEIQPLYLQSALERVCIRFPTIAAGIKQGFFQYKLYPVFEAPVVKHESECLATMTKKEIEEFAFRVLYSEKRISCEFFHSLTDGHGGAVFLNALIEEYISCKYGMAGFDPDINTVKVDESEVRDDFITYAGKKKAKLKYRRVYLLHGRATADFKTRSTARKYSIRKLLDMAHSHGASLTAILATVMAMSVSKIQNKYNFRRKRNKPIQIMVPVDLRRRFSSNTVRNFSLYALPCVEASDQDKSFEELLPIIKAQMKEQISAENMSAQMKTTVDLENNPFVRAVPMAIKKHILKFAEDRFGEESSCISLSNLGEMVLPDEIAQYVEEYQFMLTPRKKSPYNCGIVTYDDFCYITFSRFCAEPELENIFFSKLDELLASTPEIET